MEPIEEPPVDPATKSTAPTIGDLIRWYSSLEKQLGWMKNKAHHLRFLRRQEIATLHITDLTVESLVDHVRKRRLNVVKPETAMLDLELLRVVFREAQKVIGPSALLNLTDEAIATCKTLKIISKGPRRDRRPTPAELSALDQHFSRRRAGGMPMQDIVSFAIHSARSEGEICQLLWSGLDSITRTGLIPSAPTRRRSGSNGRRFRFTEEGWHIVSRQPRSDARIFPYHSQSIGRAFRLACDELQIDDLRFQDLRYEAILRLFENGSSVHEVAQITLTDSPNTLKRFVRLQHAFVDSLRNR